MWTVKVTEYRRSGETITSERNYYDVRDALTVAEIERKSALDRGKIEEGVSAIIVPDVDRLRYEVEYHGTRDTQNVIVQVLNEERSRVTLRSVFTEVR